jgi:hypothetical protein
MIGDIFYFIGLLILIMSSSNLINFLKFFEIRKWALTFKKVTGKDVDRKDFKSNEYYNIFIIYSTFILFESIWFLLGLITSSWYIFLGLTTLSVLVRIINFLKIDFISKIVGFSFQIIKFLIILALILNHFHFHLDWLQLFR